MKIFVLDHGYVEFIEPWGKGKAGVAEAGIIEAARQSTQGTFRGWERDQKLLGYLFNSKPPHASPFEFAGMTIEVQAPILVFREWHRHRTQSYNEMSARYAPLPDLYYHPSAERCLLANAGTTNKQAQNATGKELSDYNAKMWLEQLGASYAESERVYQLGLELGIPKEVARCSMAVGHYTRMRATANLRNWLAFLTLRMDPNAQWEIRQFANAVGQIVAEQFPQTWALFEDARAESADGWRDKAAKWLLEQAEAAEQTNRDHPEHAAAYQSWRDRPGVLRLLAANVQKEEAKA